MGENRETMGNLQAQGCKSLQGYFFSKPFPSEDVLAWLVGTGCGESLVLELAAG